MTPDVVELLETGRAALALELPQLAQERLIAYLALIDKWNQAFSLTAIHEPQRMVTHHLLDSLAVLPWLPSDAQQRLLDVGTGAGLPGIPLAIARPDWHVYLLDSNQ
jgi:16S rRNA (guanine527-N7)-methyltransferase